MTTRYDVLAAARGDDPWSPSTTAHLSTVAAGADPSTPGPGSEAELFDRVVDLARHHRWAIHFCRPGQTGRPQSRSWRASTTGHVGFPDLVLARGGVVRFVKLRSQRGRLTPEQRDWGVQLGALWSCWRPGDWPEIVELLTAEAGR